MELRKILLVVAVLCSLVSLAPVSQISISPYQGTSPLGVAFSMTCSGGTCNPNGPTDIIDYGTIGCPSAPPATLPASCGGSYTAPPATPCTITSLSSSSASQAETVSVSGDSVESDNICGYSATDGGYYASQGVLTVYPAGTTSSSGTATANGVVGAICSVYYIVNTIVFILALTLMILGGALYAGAQILPGSSRGVVQGYAMGLVFGGIVGAIIAVLAPYILSVVYGNSVASILNICPT